MPIRHCRASSVCKRQEVPPIRYATFDVAEIERRRARLEELLNSEIEKRGIVLPEAKSQPLALPMPGRKIEPSSHQEVIDAEFEEHGLRTMKLRAFRTLLGSLAFTSSVIACVILLKLS